LKLPAKHRWWIKEAMNLLKDRFSERQVSEKLGIDRSTLRYNLHKIGFYSSLKQGEWDISHKYFKGETKNSYGYALIKKRNHPFCDSQGYIKRSRLVMEKFLGRYLKSKEVIHHIDGNKGNDNLCNLMLFETDKLHLRYHRLTEGNTQKDKAIKWAKEWKKGIGGQAVIDFIKCFFNITAEDIKDKNERD
jgi:hypothetical protein